MPTGVCEGATEVDLEMDSAEALVYTEVKLDADPSGGTSHDAERDQLTRNLDIGYAQAAAAGKRFAVVYVTADAEEPAIVADIRRGGRTFAANPGVDPDTIAARAPALGAAGGSVGNVVREAAVRDTLGETEQVVRGFDLLAYLKKKGHWNGTLPEAMHRCCAGTSSTAAYCRKGSSRPTPAARAGTSRGSGRTRGRRRSYVRRCCAGLRRPGQRAAPC